MNNHQFTKPLYILGAFLLLSVFLFSVVSAVGPPTYSITLGTTSGTIGSVVTVTDTSSANWNNGDTMSVTITGHIGNIGNSVVVASHTFSGLTFTVPSDATVGLDTITVSDQNGNSATASFTVFVDTTPPVITLIGDDVNVEVGSSYTDDGATALDDIEGDITGSIVVGGDIVDTNTLGSYVITYDVSDSSGNAATQVTRTVEVVDTTKPTISLVGSDPVDVEVGSSYTDDGATVSDNNPSYSSIVTTGGDIVDTNTLGIYTITYDADSDASGNTPDQATRTVEVVDTTLPVITLLGTDPQTVEVGSVYTELGATALDNYDGDITGSIVIDSSAVNTAVVGLYSVNYDVTDSNTNSAVQVTRTVEVVDTTLPVITLIGSSIVVLDVDETYSDSGATASDNYDGDITSSIDTASSDVIDTSIAGVYTVTYDVADSSGNDAATITRTVIVGDANFILGNATLSFTDLPSGTFTLDVQESNSTTEDTTGFLVGGNFFDVTSDLVDGTFNVTLTFNYLDVDDDGIVDGTGIAEGDLNVYYFDGASWVIVANPIRDTVLNTITVTVNHFTVFTLFAPAPAPAATTTDDSSGGGGGGTTVRRPTTSTATGEATEGTGETTTPAPEATAPTLGFLGGITGAVVGALGTGGSMVLVIFVLGIIALAIWSVRKSMLEKKKAK